MGRKTEDANMTFSDFYGVISGIRSWMGTILVKSNSVIRKLPPMTLLLESVLSIHILLL